MNSRVSRSLDALLPPLDTHAHIDPTVTQDQLDTLGNALIFAVTRTMDEAASVVHRSDQNLLWGLGIHPGLESEVASYRPGRFRELLPSFVLVGEIGLDRKVPIEEGLTVLSDALSAAQQSGCLTSLHSTGRHAPMLDVIGSNAAGVILHWFTGTTAQIQRAASAGAYFSINSSMSDEKITAMPQDRLLPETDFPFTKKSGSSRPGDIEALERRVSDLLSLTRDETRQLWYQNLRQLCLSAGSLESLPPALAVALLSA